MSQLLTTGSFCLNHTHHAIEFSYWLAFMTGLLGAGHCLGMCGGLVSAFFMKVGASRTKCPEAGTALLLFAATDAQAYPSSPMLSLQADGRMRLLSNQSADNVDEFVIRPLRVAISHTWPGNPPTT